MAHYSSMEEDHQEMQLLSWNAGAPPPSSSYPPPPPSAPPLDLQLSISVAPSDCVLIRKVREYNDGKMESGYIETLRWEAAEQIRLAATEKAYAERVMELTRREMELAQSEFARARSLWDRAREEVERAQKMKEKATRKTDSACMDITCLSCSQKFRP